MKKDKLIIYSLEVVLLLVLFFALFVSNKLSNIILAIFLCIYLFIIKKIIKKRNAISFNYKEVILFMIGFSIIYLILFYAMGLYFGYYTNPIKFGVNSLIKFTIPISIIIFVSEKIRKILIDQNLKLSKYLTFICMVLIDLILYTKVYSITLYEDFLTILGLILFSSISCNLLYNYISTRFGDKPIIIYRLITILYMYLFPILPDVLVFFRAILRMLYPYIIYTTLEYTYSKSNFAIAYKDKKLNIIKNTICIILMLMLVMLISCKFKFGLIVIGSSSMHDTLKVGDAILYESYTNQDIYKDDIIVFIKNDIQTIHRVVEVLDNNGEIRYYTKGDANDEMDQGYVLSKDIVGVYKFKIKYIGYPSLWIRDIFN